MTCDPPYKCSLETKMEPSPSRAGNISNSKCPKLTASQENRSIVDHRTLFNEWRLIILSSGLTVFGWTGTWWRVAAQVIARVRVLVHWRKGVAESAPRTGKPRVLSALRPKMLISSSNGTVTANNKRRVEEVLTNEHKNWSLCRCAKNLRGVLNMPAEN